MEFNLTKAIIATIVFGAIATLELCLWVWREQQIAEPTVDARVLRTIGLWQDRINTVICVILLITILVEDLWC